MDRRRPVAGGLSATVDSLNRRGVTWSVVIGPSGVDFADPPFVAFTAECDGLACTFDGSASLDPEGEIVAYEWDFGDGTAGAGASAQRAYAAPDSYSVTLRVMNDSGTWAAATQRFIVTDPTTAPIFRGVSARDANAKNPLATIPFEVEAGDVLLLIATVNNVVAEVGSPEGWDLVEGVIDTEATVQTYTWSRVAQSGDAGREFVFPLDPGTKVALQVLAYHNVSQQPIAAHAVDIDRELRSDRTTPTVTVSTSSNTVISYWADKSSESTGWDPPPDVTPRASTVGEGPGRVTSLAADASPLGPGDVGGYTAVVDSLNRRGVAWTIVLTSPEE